MAYHGLSQHVNFEELPAPGDRFILQDLIGEGTYGEVYSARDTVTGKTSSHIYHALIMSNFTQKWQEFLVTFLLDSPKYRSVRAV
jgi:myosin-3